MRLNEWIHQLFELIKVHMVRQTCKGMQLLNSSFTNLVDINPEIKFLIKSNSEKFLVFTFCDSNITSNIVAYIISFVSNHHEMTFFNVKFYLKSNYHKTISKGRSCLSISDLKLHFLRMASKTVISLAKLHTWLLKNKTMSLIKILKRRGPNTDPWGTPFFMSLHELN